MTGCFSAIPASLDLRADRKDDDARDGGADVAAGAATGKEAEGAVVKSPVTWAQADAGFTLGCQLLQHGLTEHRRDVASIKAADYDGAQSRRRLHLPAQLPVSEAASQSTQTDLAELLHQPAHDPRLHVPLTPEKRRSRRIKPARGDKIRERVE